MSGTSSAGKATEARTHVAIPESAHDEAAAADYYSRTHDLSGFDGGEVVELEAPPSGTRSVTLSIRLSPTELQTLGQRAEAAGMKLTTYVRGAALQAEAPPVDDDLIETAAEVVDLVAALRASVEAAKARRQQPAKAGTATTGS